MVSEFVNIYTPDGRIELIKNARVQFVYGRRYGLIGPNGKGKVSVYNASVAACVCIECRLLR